MRMLAALITGFALLAGCGEDDESAPANEPPALADLVVTVDADGKGGKPAKETAVSCDTAEDSPVCRALSFMKAGVFEPTPGDVACTQQFGGPETATVTGTLKGEPINARFTRANGCEITRWETVTPLLDAAR
jgi:hypothetical protein